MGEKKAEVKETMSKKAKDLIQYYGTGRRKSAIARVWLRPGSGKLVVNSKEMKDYLCSEALEKSATVPMLLTNTLSQYDVKAEVKGGGIHGQADAIRHGIARALLLVNPEFRITLKKEGLLTRDPREKEAKKYGRKKARKGYQYRKR